MKHCSSSFIKAITSILIGTMCAWAISSVLHDHVRAFFPPHAPNISFSPAAWFDSADAINPNTAPVGTQLTFSIVYTHPDNHPQVIAPIT